MAVIDGVFSLIHKRETLSVVRLERREIIGILTLQMV